MCLTLQTVGRCAEARLPDSMPRLPPMPSPTQSPLGFDHEPQSL